MEDGGAAKPSVASKLAGGLLFGGPIGFIASLANEIFTEATGNSVASTVYAALSGEALPTSAASTVQVAQQQAAVADEVQVASLAQSSQLLDTAHYAQLARDAQSMAVPSAEERASTLSTRNRLLLDLYGKSVPSASEAYQRAQMLPFLKESSTHQIL